MALNEMANGFSSTLVVDLRSTRGLVYGVDAVVGGTAQQGYWSVGTSTGPEHVKEVGQALEHAILTDRKLIPPDTRRKLHLILRRFVEN